VSGVPPLPTLTPTLLPTATPLPPTATPTLTPSPTPAPAPYITAPQNGIPQITLDIALNYADRSVDVTQHILFHNACSDTWSEIVLAVPQAYYTDVFTLHTAEVTTEWARNIAETALDGTMLHVALPIPVHPNEPVQVTLSYAMTVPPVDPFTWLPEGNLGAGERLIQAGDWHPTLVPYEPGKGWHTWDYVLVGDPNVYGIANYTVQILTDPATLISAPGAVSITDQARHYTLDRGRSFAFLASPEYQILEGKAGAVPVYVYFLPEYAEAAQAVLDTAGQAIPLYEEFYGPYPGDSLVIAQNAYYGAMEYSGLVSMSGYAFETYDGNPLSLLVNLTAHEIAHQWWYGAVGQ